VNTDGVLLAALAEHNNPETILDIGTGTGVIALMLAQRFPAAEVHAVENDAPSAATAARNFQSSPFAERLAMHPVSFQDYFASTQLKYDLIVSNPPFFLNSLTNPNEQKKAARHTGIKFFEELLEDSSAHLSSAGKLALILPVEITPQITSLAASLGLNVHTQIAVRSFNSSKDHRHILIFGFGKQEMQNEAFFIYKQEKKYSQQYITALKPFFTIF
jgi:tRNA1Val (adenine37-N6)-methyltransferase